MSTFAASASRILLIDDEVAVLRLVRAMLVKHQYEVVMCGSADEGLRLLTQGKFDCVITDAIMPAVTGYDFTRAVRRNPTYHDLPILMLTRKRHRLDVKKALEAGVTDYVLKPIDETLLLDKVDLCLKKRDGKRQLFETVVSEAQSACELGLECRILSLSESGITIRTPVPLPARTRFDFTTQLFEEIGIEKPMLKLLHCEEVRAPSAENLNGLPFQLKFAFVGLPESDLKKIRAWIQRHEIQRRK